MVALKNAVQQVSSKFKYRKDPDFILDYWYVMRERNNQLQGDCEDFTLTTFWYLSNKNILVFLWHLFITHKYKVYLCKTFNNGSHAVGAFGDLYFDNWTLEALPREEFIKRTRHTGFTRCLFIHYPLPMLLGFIVRWFR